jgi:ribosomal 30S subunit maturation factor RimM
LTEVTAGQVGRPHGRDGSFYVEGAAFDFPEGSHVRLAGTDYEVVRRAGTDDRPLIRLDGIDDPASVRGEIMLIEEDLEEDEYLVADLVGCEVPGLGYVERVLDAPSCTLLEVGMEGHLVPLIGDAVKHIDLERKIIEVDREFLGY